MDINTPILTVVIPVYNRRVKVRATLACISAQTSRDFCVVLVDNNSTDGTADELRDWAAGQAFPVTVLTEQRRGAAAARARGLQEVRTPWTMFFDSDDTMTPDHIACAVEAIRANPEADMIGWCITHFAGKGTGVVKPFAANQYDALFNGTMATQRYCARTGLFRHAGGWDPAVGVWDDIELGARLIALQPRVVTLKGSPRVGVYLGEDSISQGENVENIAALDLALNRIAATLDPTCAHWVELRRLILAGRSRGEVGKCVAAEVLARRPRHRHLLRLAYLYTRLGGRGAARLLRPFI